MSALLFAASPLSALWSLAGSVQHNDVSGLRDGMDWRALRLALKGEINDVVHPAAAPVGAEVKLASATIRATPVVAADDDLPEFGSSFVTHVVSNAVDDEVTPEHLLDLLHPDGAAATPTPSSLLSALHRVAGLAFTAPNRFEAAFLLSDQPGAEPVHVALRIEQWRWKIVAIHLPASAAPDSTDRT